MAKCSSAKIVVSKSKCFLFIHQRSVPVMSSLSTPDREKQSFAEAALRLSGKTEEEARRTGALDKADEQVESLFAPQYQTVNSPVHKAVWEGKTPLDLFNPPPHE